MCEQQQVLYLATVGHSVVGDSSIKHGRDGRCQQVAGRADSLHVRPLVLDEAPHHLCLAALQPPHLRHALHRIMHSCTAPHYGARTTLHNHAPRRIALGIHALPHIHGCTMFRAGQLGPVVLMINMIITDFCL